MNYSKWTFGGSSCTQTGSRSFAAALQSKSESASADVSCESIGEAMVTSNSFMHSVRICSPKLHLKKTNQDIVDSYLKFQVSVLKDITFGIRSELIHNVVNEVANLFGLSSRDRGGGSGLST